MPQIKRLRLNKPVNQRGENDPFPYLLFKRPGEKISRVDRYSITLYWDTLDAEGNPITKSELFFYPSDFGMEEIRKYARGDEMLMENSGTARLIHRLEQLMQFGNPWWRHDTKTVLTPDNWVLDGSIKADEAATYLNHGYNPTINNSRRMKLTVKTDDPSPKPIKRLKLKAK